MGFLAVAVAALLLGLAGAPAIHAASSGFVSIDYPGALGTLSAGVNNLGQVVGTYSSAQSPCFTNYLGNQYCASGYLLSSGAYTTINGPPSGASPVAFMHGINTAGGIVGNLPAYFYGVGEGFLYSQGVYAMINDPNACGTNFPGITGATATDAQGINDQGQIVGTFEECSGNAYGYVLSGIGGSFTTIDYPGSVLTFAFGINNGGTVVGYYTDSSGNSHGFVYDSGTYTSIDYPGATNTVAQGINNNGEVVGSYVDSSGNQHGFIYLNGVFSATDVPGAILTIDLGVNDNGEIVGAYIDASGNSHGFITGPNLQFTVLDFPGASSTSAEGINGQDQVVGTHSNSPGASHGYLLSGGTYSDINAPASVPQLSAINDYGLVVGNFLASFYGVGNGFVYNSTTSQFQQIPADPSACADGSVNGVDQTATQASGVNDLGTIVGAYEDCGGSVHAFILTGFPGASYSFSAFDVPVASAPWLAVADGINNLGQIVGYYHTSNGANHGYLRQADGTFYYIDFPPSQSPTGTVEGTTPESINDQGQVVGYYTDGNGVNHGFLLSSGAFSTIDYPLGAQTYALGVGPDGSVVGEFIDAAGNGHGFVLTPLDQTKTAVTCSPVPMVSGGSTDCTVVVAGSTPTGQVDFTATGQVALSPSSQSCTLDLGSCSVTFTCVNLGRALVVAVYQGDASNSPSSSTTSVRIVSSAQAIRNLLTLQTSMGLTQGPSTSLSHTLDAALKSIGTGHTHAAVAQLDAYISEVSSLPPSDISTAQAQQLIAAAQAILSSISG